MLFRLFSLIPGYFQPPSIDRHLSSCKLLFSEVDTPRRAAALACREKNFSSEGDLLWKNETRVARIDLRESRLVSFMFLSSAHFCLYLDILSFSMHQLISSSCTLFLPRSTPRGERQPSTGQELFIRR